MLLPVGTAGSQFCMHKLCLTSFQLALITIEFSTDPIQCVVWSRTLLDYTVLCTVVCRRVSDSHKVALRAFPGLRGRASGRDAPAASDPRQARGPGRGTRAAAAKRRRGLGCSQAPQPSDHVLTLLDAGERVFQTFLLTKQLFMHSEEHSHSFMHI